MERLNYAPSLLTRVVKAAVPFVAALALVSAAHAEVHSVQKEQFFSDEVPLSKARQQLIISMQEDLKGSLASYIIADQSMETSGSFSEKFDVISMAKMQVEVTSEEVSVVEGGFNLNMTADIDVDEEDLSKRVESYYAEIDARNELSRMKSKYSDIESRIDRLEAKGSTLNEFEQMELSRLKIDGEHNLNRSGAESLSPMERAQARLSADKDLKLAYKERLEKLVSAMRADTTIEIVDAYYCNESSAPCGVNRSASSAQIDLKFGITPRAELMASQFLGYPIKVGDKIGRREYIAMSPMERENFWNALNALYHMEPKYVLHFASDFQQNAYPIRLNGRRNIKSKLNEVRENPYAFPAGTYVSLIELYGPESRQEDRNSKIYQLSFPSEWMRDIKGPKIKVLVKDYLF